jgi:hypothetical protein
LARGGTPDHLVEAQIRRSLQDIEDHIARSNQRLEVWTYGCLVRQHTLAVTPTAETTA